MIVLIYENQKPFSKIIFSYHADCNKMYLCILSVVMYLCMYLLFSTSYRPYFMKLRNDTTVQAGTAT